MKSQGDGASDGLEPPGVTGHRDTEQRQSLFPIRIACLARNNKAKLERKRASTGREVRCACVG